MARFRNNTDTTLSVNQPTGHPDAHAVESGKHLKVPGEIVNETDDAYIVAVPDTDIDYGGFVQPDGSVTLEQGEEGKPNRGPELQAYPKALWSAVKETSSKSSQKEGE